MGLKSWAGQWKLLVFILLLFPGERWHHAERERVRRAKIGTGSLITLSPAHTHCGLFGVSRESGSEKRSEGRGREGIGGGVCAGDFEGFASSEWVTGLGAAKQMERVGMTRPRTGGDRVKVREGGRAPAERRGRQDKPSGTDIYGACVRGRGALRSRSGVEGGKGVKRDKLTLGAKQRGKCGLYVCAASVSVCRFYLLEFLGLGLHFLLQRCERLPQLQRLIVLDQHLLLYLPLSTCLKTLQKHIHFTS